MSIENKLIQKKYIEILSKLFFSSTTYNMLIIDLLCTTIMTKNKTIFKEQYVYNDYIILYTNNNLGNI